MNDLTNITFGKVPHPAFKDRLITTKPEGIGWNNLGKRSPKGVVLHRMIGTLNGTDGWFRRNDVQGLTDYGVGVLAVEGAAGDGMIYRWTDPYGYISGWASGPVSAPYGDGLLFINQYGVNAVNRYLVSIEISGNYETAWSDKSFEAVAQLVAHFADQYKIPYYDFPYIKAEGRSFIMWHQEFTIGTGKVCPGSVVMNATNRLITRVQAIMKQHQEKKPMPEPVVYVFDPKLVWPTQSTGPVGRMWEEHSRKTQSWGKPTKVWNKDDGKGGKLFLFTNGLLIRQFKENGITKTVVV